MFTNLSKDDINKISEYVEEERERKKTMARQECRAIAHRTKMVEQL